MPLFPPFVGVRLASQALRLAPAPLLGEPAAARFGRGLGRPAPPPHLEPGRDRLSEAFEGELAVSPLAPLLLSYRADEGAGPLDEAPLLGVGEHSRGFDVENRLDAGLGLLRMLTSGPARAREPELDLAERKRKDLPVAELDA
jgi:hypothetical protein